MCYPSKNVIKVCNKGKRGEPAGIILSQQQHETKAAKTFPKN